MQGGTSQEGHGEATGLLLCQLKLDDVLEDTDGGPDARADLGQVSATATTIMR